MNGAARRLEGVERLARGFVRREAVASSGIEGTLASTTDLALFEAGRDEAVPLDVREVSSYREAFDFVMTVKLDRPFNLTFVRELHTKLMAGMSHGSEHGGNFRDIQNCIAVADGTLSQAIYVPPPPLNMLASMNDWADFARSRGDVPPLIAHALLHYKFEAIHPFVDGNGRIGRLLIAYFMRSDEMLEHPLFTLSSYLERNRPSYYDLLGRVTSDGDWEAWIHFYLDGIQAQAAEALLRIERLSELRKSYREMLIAERVSALTLQLADELFSTPAVSLGNVTTLLAVTPTTAQKIIDRYLRLGILREATQRKRDRIYLAEDVILAAG